MKAHFRNIMLVASLAAVPAIATAADCELNVAVLAAPQSENVPEAALQYLTTRLAQSATQSGIVADVSGSNFFITGKFNHIQEDVLPGPPAQTALHTVLTLYAGNVNDHTIYAMKTFELRGVGTSTERAFINAMRAINSRNSEVAAFVNEATGKIFDYYDKNYPSIVERAERASSLHHYDEALYLLTQVPECCKGYGKVAPLVDKAYQNYIDYVGAKLLTVAQAEWSRSPNEHGATLAFANLVQIDTESSAYAGAQKLAAEIKASVKSDRDFELREKYHDSVELEKRRIEAARAVGVAFGNGQQPTTTNLMWLR